MVRLAVAENAGSRAEAILAQLRSLVEVECGNRWSGAKGWDGSSTAAPTEEELRSSVINRRVDAAAKHQSPTADSPSPGLPISRFPPLITAVGREGDRVFAAAPWINGRTAAEWIVHHGRFPAEVVLEIARAMLVELAALEKARVCHGDVSTSSLILSDAGNVAMAMPGLRAVLRPEEGYAHADLLPEAFDSLAPERIASGTSPNTTSDVYACGCVWWHLLCGRPPLAGGNSLTKLRAAQAGGICDVRRHAPDAPPALAAAIAACVEVEPSRRPESMARLAAMLGSPTRNGKGALADCLSRTGRPTVHWTTTASSIRRSSRTPLWVAGAACCLAAMVAMFWPLSHKQGLGGSPPSSPCETASGRGGHREAASGSHRSPGSMDRVQSTVEENAVVPATFQQPLQPPPDLVLTAGNASIDKLASCARTAGSHGVGPSRYVDRA